MIKKFIKYQGQTTDNPMGLEVIKAKGSYIYTKDKKYLDFVAGVSVNNLGHSNPIINNAIINQLKDYSHVMVYGEFILKPSIKLCELISKILPSKLDSTYLTNSGTEAIEASLKLAKRSTGRQKIISMINSYHGSTHGSLSVSGFEKRKRRYRPLLPNIFHINFNSLSDLELIDNSTSCVIIEPIQGGAGFLQANMKFLRELRKKCDNTGAVLIFDELQSGLGRTGKMFAFQHYGIIPDILVIGKALGGGFPIGALICNKSLMDKFKYNPILGHITTFGGHPVIAKAGIETIKYILKKNLQSKALQKEKLFKSVLKHELISEIRGKGLMIAMIMKSEKIANYLVQECLKKGLIVFFLLYEKKAIRITPPLTISKKEIKIGCKLIIELLNEY